MIDLTRPVPCLKFDGCPISEQMEYIAGEVDEARRAYDDYCRDLEYNRESTAVSKDHVAEELTDVITAATTALAMLGYNNEARIIMQRKVNEKNRVRGYWGEEQTE